MIGPQLELAWGRHALGRQLDCRYDPFKMQVIEMQVIVESTVPVSAQPRK
jgi:hypothetical protein